jgi:hypothetical protein
MGDVPYAPSGIAPLDAMIDEMNAQPLAFVVHVGDITSGSGPCGDDWLAARKAQFAQFRAPFVLLPGDNEWTDCRRTGFDPGERLSKWRELFCLEVKVSSFERQPGRCENARWIHDNFVFVGLNVPGGNNNLAADPLEHGERMRAVYAWLDAAEAMARGRDGLVILMQANPFVKPRLGGANGYDGILQRLRRLGREMPGRVLLVHGDTHYFRDDRPLPGLRRVEVFGWPQIRWVRARIAPGAAPFRVEAVPQ